MAAGAGLCPVEAPDGGHRWHDETLRRLLKLLGRGDAREEGAHGGTRGSPVLSRAATVNVGS